MNPYYFKSLVIFVYRKETDSTLSHTQYMPIFTIGIAEYISKYKISCFVQLQEKMQYCNKRVKHSVLE